MIALRSTIVLALCAAHAISAQAQRSPDNSNFWPVYRDTVRGFRISYPRDWSLVEPKGPNTRFSVNPPGGPGNCNVVVRPATRLTSLSQAELNRDIAVLPTAQADWASYVGVPPVDVTLISTRRARIVDVPALLGTVEVSLETLEGKFLRKQTTAMTLTPGFIWTINCGVSAFSAEQVRNRFAALDPTFQKLLGSFVLLK